MNRKLRICDCCDDSIVDLRQNLWFLQGNELADRVRKDLGKISPNFEHVDGIINMLCNKPDDLDENGRRLLVMLTDYLIIAREKRDEEKYLPSIWDFIYGCLQLPRNCGYDYFLMCYLDTYEIMEHGSGIRCGWIANSDCQPLELNRQLISTWLTKNNCE